jgi:hypothetical protein
VSVLIGEGKLNESIPMIERRKVVAGAEPEKDASSELERQGHRAADRRSLEMSALTSSSAADHPATLAVQVIARFSSFRRVGRGRFGIQAPRTTFHPRPDVDILGVLYDDVACRSHLVTVFLPAMATRTIRGRGRQRNSGSASALVDDLTSSIEKLIQENKTLKREIARLEAREGSSMSTRALGILRRKAAQALGTKASKGQSTRRRRVTDPEVLQRRRQAMAKAREALAAKRASGGS